MPSNFQRCSIFLIILSLLSILSPDKYAQATPESSESTVEIPLGYNKTHFYTWLVEGINPGSDFLHKDAISLCKYSLRSGYRMEKQPLRKTNHADQSINGNGQWVLQEKIFKVFDLNKFLREKKIEYSGNFVGYPPKDFVLKSDGLWIENQLNRVLILSRDEIKRRLPWIDDQTKLEAFHYNGSLGLLLSEVDEVHIDDRQEVLGVPQGRIKEAYELLSENTSQEKLFDQAEARELHTEGYHLHQKGNYEEAADLFRMSIDADPAYASPYYNLACSLSLLRKKDTCRYQAYKEIILENLKKAVELNPKLKDGLKTDSDLTAIRDTFQFQIWSGLSLNNDRDLKIILQNIIWYENEGSYAWASVRSKLVFKKNGGFLLQSKYNKEILGHYKVQETKIYVHFNKPFSGGSRLEYIGTLSQEGNLTFDANLGQFADKFTDSFTECSNWK